MAMTVLRKLDPWLPPLLLMGVIFMFSAQHGPTQELGTLDVIVRKLVHFSEYALLCFLWWRVVRRFTDARRAALIALAIASGYAITDEFHQTFVQDRHGTPVDWLIDTSGAAFAAFLIRSRTRVRV